MLIARVSQFGSPESAVELVEQAEPGDPGPDEVVVAAQYVPINPADLLNIEGKYGVELPPLPLTPGSEGVGRVEKIGAQVRHVKVGDRVLIPGPGCWRQRIRAPARSVFALPPDVDPKQLAMLRVNPPTAHLMLTSIVKLPPGAWVIQNAANSGVGQWVIRLAQKYGWKTINIVRREELVAPLLALGADKVFVDGSGLASRVRAEIGEAPLPLGFDAIAGDATRRLARCLSNGGTIVNYGVLSDEPCSIDGRDTVFRDLRLCGFWLRKWFGDTSPEQIAALYRELAARVADGTFTVDIESVYPFQEIKKAVAHAARGGRSGKILMSFE